ncbi:MAG: hypothetical protein NVS1B13_19120 [Flavisolibacter sp.]
MVPYKDTATYYFLQGGGEMGQLIRAKDWSHTSIGSPDNWPNSLQTLVSVMLDNPFGTYIAWGKDFIQLYNDGYRPILGASKHPQALGISTRDTFSEIWHIIGPMFEGVMTGKAVGFADFMLPLNRYGYVEECYFDFSYSPIRKDNGEVGGVLVTVIETTNKKKAEEALVQSEQRFRTMADNIPNLAWMAEPDGSIFWYNKKWYEYTGTTPDQMKGWGWQVVHDPAHLPLVLELWVKSISSGQPFEMTFPLKGADHNYRQFLTRVLPVRNPKGEIYQWFGTNTDITERIEAEQNLKKSEDNLRNVILQAPVAMCILRGPEYIVEIANEKMFELWGKSLEEVINKPVFEGLPEARDQGLEALLFNVYTTGETFSANGLAVNLPRKGSMQTVYINFVYEAFKDGDGSISGIMAVAVDVTEQILARNKIEEVVAQRTEELASANLELSHTNSELARSNANLEEFAYAASHDMKEPVRKIHFFTDRLKASLGDRITEEEALYLGRLEMASRRMSSLIDDLLSYSMASIKPKEMESINLNQLMDIVLSDLELEIEEKRAMVVVEELCTIKGYPRQLQQAFQNLIGNALKYNKPGIFPEINIKCKLISGKELHLQIPAENQHKEYFDIFISDNGIGFEQKDSERIFNVFTRLHSNAEYKGTGVGLSIVRKVIENHNGYISALSKLGEGSVFHIFIPAD